MRECLGFAALGLLLPVGVALAADPITQPLVPPVTVSGLHAVSGYVEAFGQVAWDQLEEGDYSPWWGGGAAGHINIWLVPGWSAQLDLAGSSVAERYENTYRVGSLDLVGHISKREPYSHVFGGFVQLSAFGDYDDTTSTFAAVGGEGQWYHDRLTAYGQVAFITGISGEEIDAYPMDLGYGRIALRYYPRDNTKLEVGLGLISGPIWGPDYDDTSSLFWNAEIEHRLDGAPWSLFAEVAGIHGGGYHDWQSVNRVMLGAKAHFGNDTLLGMDRHGATLEGIDGSLVSWLRWE